MKLKDSFFNPRFRDRRQAIVAAVLGLTAFLQAAHAAPMLLFYSSARGDNFSAASPIEFRNAGQAGYQQVRVQAYAQTQTALHLYYHAGRGDNFTTATARGKRDARANVGAALSTLARASSLTSRT